MGKGSGLATREPKEQGQPAQERPPARPPSREIKALLEASRDRLLAVLPKHLTPERMAQVVTTIVYRTPKLQECDPNTILSSVLEACELGLELSPKLGEGYLVPFWNRQTNSNVCTFLPGYQGLVKLARQHPDVVMVHSRIVYEKDRFSVDFTPDLDFRHTPHLGADRGPRTLVYAVAKLRSGDHVIEVMNPDELEAIHRRSQSYQNAVRFNKAEDGPWVTDRGEMERKTALKRLCKALPRSIQLARAIAADDELYADQSGIAIVTRTPQAGLTKSARLAAQLTGPPADEPEFTEGTSGVIATDADEGPAEDGAGEGDPDYVEGLNC